MPQEHLQDKILNQLRKQRMACAIHLTNGFKINNAMIRAFDNFVVVIQTEEQSQMMLYKHGISSITMLQPIQLGLSADHTEG